MLIHRRADDKYHSGGLWTNACCSHPFENEKIENAAHRRLKEELGIESELTKAFDFIYKAKLENGLEEHEYDHVLLGNHNGPVYPDLSEVAEWKFADLAWIDQRTTQSPHEFTPWFIIALPKVLSFLKSKQLQQ